MGRRKGQIKVKVTFYIVEEVARALRIEAAYQGRRQSALVDDALEDYLKKFKKGKEVSRGC